MSAVAERTRIARALEAAGCVAPEAEAHELLDASERGRGRVDELLARRIGGEPLAWVVGSVEFCGLRVRVDPGVFVPRPQTEALARRAASLLRPAGVAVDLCTGSGAIAAFLSRSRPAACVVASDVDATAVACARANGVEAFLGDLADPLPRSLRGRVDVVTAVVPYVPGDELHLLPRDVVAFEPRRALDGGARGTTTLVRAAREAAAWLRPGGTVLLEIGGDQAAEVGTELTGAGLTSVRVHRDGDGRDRSIEARSPHPLTSRPRRGRGRPLLG